MLLKLIFEAVCMNTLRFSVNVSSINLLLGIFYIGDKMYLETDLRHPKFDTFRMPAAQQEWMLENADPRSGPDGINDKSIFYRRFLWFWAAGVVFFFGLWNELQKVDFLHSEGRRNRTLCKWHLPVEPAVPTNVQGI